MSAWASSARSRISGVRTAAPAIRARAASMSASLIIVVSRLEALPGFAEFAGSREDATDLGPLGFGEGMVQGLADGREVGRATRAYHDLGDPPVGKQPGK